MIPYGTQSIDNDDIQAVRDVLTSPYLTTGPAVSNFEDKVASYVGANYAVAVNSCTSALHLAMCALGVDKTSRVFVSAISFVASANCARYLGADVDFVDVDKHTGNMDIDCLEQMLIEAKKENRLPKVVVAVDLSGRACDLERLSILKSIYGFYLLEDAAHALGATYKGTKVGSCLYSDITVFSFHPVKIITTAEGGMCLTNNEKFYKTMRLLSSHGIEHDDALMKTHGKPAYYYEMQQLGFNYRLSDLQAALGISQLEKIDSFLARRREIAKEYQDLLSDDKRISLPVADTDNNQSSWHLYQVGIEPNIRDEIFNTLRSRGIGVQIHYIPIYHHPYYQELKDYKPLAGAEYFYSRTLTIPCYPKLTNLDLQMSAATLLGLVDKLS